jgi:diguanylate cyclase (GGDEF)-like protein
MLVFFYASVAYIVALFYAQGFMTLRFWKTMLILAAGAVVYLPVLPWDIIIKANLDRDSALHLSSLIIIVLTGIISLYRRESLQRYNFVVRKQLDDKYENLQLMTKQLEELADQDPLTCLFNRRAFARVAHEAMALSVRNNKPFSIILCDVDFFKRYNDTYGHVAGDLVLKQVTEMMSLSMRRTVDVVARFGGEEFIMLLPDTNMVGAETALRALYDRLASMNIEHEDSPLRRVTISSGVYVYTPGDRIDIDDVDEIIRKADTALYKSKQTGRNRITFYDGDDV